MPFTGKHIKLSWTSEHLRKYRWLFNKLSETDNKLNEENYLLKISKTKLIKSIKNFKLSDSSTESIFFTVARYYEINKPEEENKIKEFKQLGYNLKIKRQNKDADNELDEKEKDNYRDLDYFKTLVKNINYNDITNIKDHYQYLLLNLLVYQPPVRTNFYNTAIITTSNKHDNDKNYLWLTKKGKDRAYYIINTDKVSNTKQYKNNPDLSVIEIENNDLIKLIYDSFKKYPRDYLFENLTTKTKMKPDTLLSYLKQVTKLNINFDMMRSIFVTDFHNKNKTLKSKQGLAKKMRHSVAISQQAYYKNVEPETKHDKNELVEENILLKQQVQDLKQQILKLQEQLKPDDKLYNKRKADILYNLNERGNTPKQTTLDKYGIKFDNKANKYY